MPEYRAYIVDGDGHFAGCELMVCRNDGEAVAQALHLLDGHDIEVWQRERFVVKVARPVKRRAASLVGAL